MKRYRQEHKDGINSIQRNQFILNGMKNQLTFMIHHSLNQLKNNSLKFQEFKMPMFWHFSVTLLQLIIFHQQVTFQSLHRLQDFWRKEELRRRISILMVPEEVTIWSWQEVLLLTSESSIKWWKAKLDQKLFIFPPAKFCQSLMLLRNINKKNINWLSLEVKNMVLVQAEIGLLKVLTYKE